MKRTTKYVGLDVHQATTVASVREESGRVLASTIVPTEGGAPRVLRHDARQCARRFRGRHPGLSGCTIS
jgi:hypothetical protein